MPTYYPNYNGQKPFKVDVNYKTGFVTVVYTDDVTDGLEGKVAIRFQFEGAFIGEGLYEDSPRWREKAVKAPEGNTLLLKVKPHHYVYICESVTTFHTE